MIKEDRDSFMIVVFILNMIFTGSIPLVAVILPRYIIDAISSSQLNETLIYIALFGMISMILSVISIKLTAIANGKFAASRMRRSKMHNEKFRHVSMKHLESSDFHSKRAEASLALQYSTHGYQGTLSVVFKQLPEIFTIIGFIIILGLFNPWVIVIAFGCAIAQFFLALKSKQYAVDRYKSWSDRNRISGYYYGVTHDFSYGKDIRVNKLSNPLKKLYEEKSNKVLDWLRGRDLNEYKYNLFDIIFLLITNGASYYLIIKAYFDGSVTLGTVSMAIMTVLAITVKLQNTFKEVASLKELTESTKKYIKFFNSDYEYDVDNGEPVNTKDMTIEFVNVSFKYPSSEKFVLQDLSLKIDSKQKIALVGINGSGKSTIVKLLCGFYVPTEGDIYIDGINTKTMNIPAYQQQLSIVFQDVNLYAASIIENITGPSPSTEDEQRVVDALRQIGLLDKVMSLEKKQYTNLLKVVDPDGVELSGGEIQKLSIARAIYKENTKLIILDEPTAALDAIAEREIYEHFNELVKNKTAIMISHRLASTKFCDSIIFLEGGRIIEKGTHNKLMAIEDGKYKEMFLAQGKYYTEEGLSYEN
jgi:ABC-type multidrug transport system fused ATPase/permease subunit